MISTGGEGKISAKKRLRGKIGDPSTKPELKQYNLLDSSQGDLNRMYDTVVFYGTYLPDNNSQFGVWEPLMCRWPPLGQGMSSRIGKRIRVKYLRIKGYVSASPFLTNQVRYRLVLYRTRANQVNGVETYNQAWLASLYKHYHNYQDTDMSATALQTRAARNYYMSVFDKDSLQAKDCKRRVLCSGLLKPSADIGNYTIPANSATQGYFLTKPDNAPSNIDTITGQAAGQIERGAQFITSVTDIPLRGTFQRHVATADLYEDVNAFSFFPVDITVSMNDNVDTYEYRYILVLESDWAIGQQETGLYSNGNAYSNFKMRICPQIYYFDD